MLFVRDILMRCHHFRTRCLLLHNFGRMFFGAHFPTRYSDEFSCFFVPLCALCMRFHARLVANAISR
jgi:hypothetical protein